MHEEIERCEALGIPLLVHHPGAWTSSTLEAGLERIAQAYAELFARTKGYRTVCCLENTAGAGTTIGRRFEDLARLRGMIVDRTGEGRRVGYCIDTCHAFAAGYDLSTPAGAAKVLEEIGAMLGFERVHLLHLNDSKGALGSRLDRHEHIGRGLIGEPGFAAVVRDARLAHTPKILETPKGPSPAGDAWDAVNLRELKGLSGVAVDSAPKLSHRPPKRAGGPMREKPRPATTKKAAGARSRRARRA
jgi:deoxyribonuclease-4